MGAQRVCGAEPAPLQLETASLRPADLTMRNRKSSQTVGLMKSATCSA
jgi:hypothetical protein